MWQHSLAEDLGADAGGAITKQAVAANLILLLLLAGTISSATRHATASLTGLYSCQDGCRDLRGTKETRHPPGTGIIRNSLSLERSSSGSTDLNSSGAGNSRSSRRRGVGGTGECTGSLALGSRDFTAARSGWPCGNTAPHAAQILPPWFTPSHTGQRQTLMAAYGRCVFARAFRPGGPGDAARCPEAAAPRSATPCHEGPMPDGVGSRPPVPT
jgi:hypothetical protein